MRLEASHLKSSTCPAEDALCRLFGALLVASHSRGSLADKSARISGATIWRGNLVSCLSELMVQFSIVSYDAVSWSNPGEATVATAGAQSSPRRLLVTHSCQCMCSHSSSSDALHRWLPHAAVADFSNRTTLFSCSGAGTHGETRGHSGDGCALFLPAHRT